MFHLIKEADVFGEVIRDIAFQKRLGCYSCFDLVETFREAKPSQRLISALLGRSFDGKYDAGLLRETSAYRSDLLDMTVAWHWDGDGMLYVSHAGRAAVNHDCKKDHDWEWVSSLHLLNEARAA